MTASAKPELESAIASLPHAYPFLLVDRILVRERGRWAVSIKNLTRNDPLMDEKGHLPSALVVEAMAQTAGLAAFDGSAGEPAFLARINRFRCRPPFVAGDQLLITVRVVRRLGGSVKVRGSVRVADRWRAAAELVLHGPRPLPGAGAGET